MEHPTQVIEWLEVREDGESYGGKVETLNAQRSTPNVQKSSELRFDLEERLLEFSANIIRLIDGLPNTRAANHIAGQLLRCGTSPYGNHGEVEAAESRKDFVHKLEGLPERTEGDSSLVTTDRKIVDAAGDENALDPQ